MLMLLGIGGLGMVRPSRRRPVSLAASAWARCGSAVERCSSMRNLGGLNIPAGCGSPPPGFDSAKPGSAAGPVSDSP